jgi:hypothetical protein
VLLAKLCHAVKACIVPHTSVASALYAGECPPSCLSQFTEYCSQVAMLCFAFEIPWFQTLAHRPAIVVLHGSSQSLWANADLVP